jgi:hypothetical protein
MARAGEGRGAARFENCVVPGARWFAMAACFPGILDAAIMILGMKNAH